IAHLRENLLRNTQRAEEVGFELVVRLGQTRLFERANQGVAGVVHEYVNAAGAVKYSRDGMVDTRIIANVHLEQRDRFRQVRRAARPIRSEDVKTTFCEQNRGSVPNTRRYAGYQRHWLHVTPP